MTLGKQAAGIRMIVIVCSAALIPSCRPPAAPPPPLPTDAVRTALEARVGPAQAKGPVMCRSDRICGSEVLPSFYRARDFRPAWIDDGLSLDDAFAFLDALRRVDEDGLNPGNYHLSVIESLIAEVRTDNEKENRKTSPETLVDLEMLLTDAFFLCGSHLVHGQVDPETIQSDWHIKGRTGDLAAALEKGLSDKDIAAALDSLRPRHAVYKGLKEAYRTFRAAAEPGGLPGFPPGGKLRKGDRGGRIEALRKALEAKGESAPAEGRDRSLFDDRLETAVKSFQRRFGLEPDGIVGASTTSGLNVSAAGRAAQIRANLERWRWISSDLGDRHILVNIADFRLAVFEGDREIMSMPAIVGTPYRTTPEFSGKMTYIEINPSWTIPPKLAREDILPRIRKDRNYLANMNISVFKGWSAKAHEVDPYKIDWSKVDGERMPYKFRQEPGAQNSLGRIKFMFPNKFDVYLHDTPERWLFSRSIRNFSSGCIRIERPLDLAEYLLRDDPKWSREKILEALDDLKTRVVILRNPIPVHLLYWTAWRDGGGRVQFREDIYKRDAALVRALEQAAPAFDRTGRSPGPDAADVDVDKTRRGIDSHAPAP